MDYVGSRQQQGGNPMKAIVNETYGSPDVLELQEVEKPTPKDDEVLMLVRASSVNTSLRVLRL